MPTVYEVTFRIVRSRCAILFRGAEGRVLDVQWAGPRRVALVIDWVRSASGNSRVGRPQ